MNALESNPLDDLLTSAMLAATPRKERARDERIITAEQLAAAEKRVRAVWYDEKNWVSSGFVALKHKETDTLLGNFEIKTHTLSKGTRKLIRVNEPHLVGSVEWVSGEQWIGERVNLDATPLDVEEREIILDVHLKELGNLFAPNVMLTVRIEYGGVARAELTEPTRFFDKARREVLELEEGLCVLEAMSLDNKLDLRGKLGL